MKLITGIIIGMLLGNLVSILGEQRYSNAIKECVKELGPNK